MHVCVMCEGFVCGHSETVEYVWLGGSGSGGCRDWDAEFSGCCLYMDTNMYWDFQICISVPISPSAFCEAICIYHVYK